MLKEVNSEEFKELAGKGLVLADFFSTTCGPCKMLGFVLKDVEKEFGDDLTILKVDFDQNKDLTAEYGVTGYPTLVLLKDGQRGIFHGKGSQGRKGQLGNRVGRGIR